VPPAAKDPAATPDAGPEPTPAQARAASKIDQCDGTSCHWLALTRPDTAAMANVQCSACGQRAWRG
jgi:hypothetical protein